MVRLLVLIVVALGGVALVLLGIAIWGSVWGKLTSAWRARKDRGGQL